MWAERGENLQEALAMIEKAVKFEPKNAAFLDSLGWVLFKLNKPEEALPHMLKSIEFNDEPDATSTLMVWRLRNTTTRMASPMADSAAATVRMKNTKT